jgi:hypothetical protein
VIALIAESVPQAECHAREFCGRQFWRVSLS